MAALIDVTHFKTVSLGNPSFAREIIDRFLVQSQLYKAQLDTGMEQQDFRIIKNTMQQLKAQALVFGAVRLVQLIKRIEMANLDRFEQFMPVVADAYRLFTVLVEEAEQSKGKV